MLKSLSYCLAAVFAESFGARCWVRHENVVVCDAPTTSEWSTILLPTKVQLILEVLQLFHLKYVLHHMIISGIGMQWNRTFVLSSGSYNLFMLQKIWIPITMTGYHVSQLDALFQYNECFSSMVILFKNRIVRKPPYFHNRTLTLKRYHFIVKMDGIPSSAKFQLFSMK